MINSLHDPAYSASKRRRVLRVEMTNRYTGVVREWTDVDVATENGVVWVDGELFLADHFTVRLTGVAP